MKLSFKYRFILSFVTIEAFFLTLIVVINFNAINETSQNLIRNKIHSTGILLTELIKVPLSIYDLATLDGTLQSATNLESLAAIRVMDAKNRIVSESIKGISLEDVDAFSNGDIGKRFESKGRTYHVEKLPLSVEEARIGNLLMVYDMTNNIAFIEKNKQKTYLIILIEILLSTLVSYLIGHKLTHSLMSLSQAADDIANNVQGKVPELERSDEIGVLAHSMKVMQENIKDRNEKLQASAQKLEALNKSLEKQIVQEVRKSREKDKMMLKHARQAAMGEMIGMIAHQWRQPITGIGMTVNNLSLDIEMGVLEDDKAQKNLKLISDQVQYLSRTIDDFRNFFRPNKEKTLSSIPEVVDETLKIIGKSLENSNIRIERTHADHTPILMYKNELVQVFMNLMKNTQDVLNEHERPGNIWIESSEDSTHITVALEDNGGGIPEEIMYRIFEPYYSTKSEKTGTGLGLYMCKAIIEEHLHGEIIAYNGDRGAKFVIRFPKNNQPESM